MVQKKTDFFEPAEVDVFRAGWTRSHAGRPPFLRSQAMKFLLYSMLNSKVTSHKVKK